MADQTLDYGLVSNLVTAQYLSIVLLTILVYYSITTMDKSVKYFWSKSRRLTSLIFCTNICVGLIGQICYIIRSGFQQSILSCRATIWIGDFLNLITIVLIDYILQVRVLALYQQNKGLSIFLKVLLVIDAGLDLSLLIYGFWYEKVSIDRLAESIKVCLISDPPQFAAIVSWSIPLTYGSLLLGLALFKATEYWRMSSGFKGLHLVRVLIQDQVLYYGFVVFCCILKIMEFRIVDINPFVADVLTIAGSPCFLCVLGSHLLINMKEAGERGGNEGTSYKLRTFSDVEFAEGASTVDGPNEGPDNA